MSGDLLLDFRMLNINPYLGHPAAYILESTLMQKMRKQFEKLLMKEIFL